MKAGKKLKVRKRLKVGKKLKAADLYVKTVRP